MPRSSRSAGEGHPDGCAPPADVATGWRRIVLLAVIALQVAVPTLMLVLRLTGDGSAMRFGWQMFSGVP
jgi:hypothetical protein